MVKEFEDVTHVGGLDEVGTKDIITPLRVVQAEELCNADLRLVVIGDDRRGHDGHHGFEFSNDVRMKAPMRWKTGRKRKPELG